MYENVVAPRPLAGKGGIPLRLRFLILMLDIDAERWAGREIASGIQAFRLPGQATKLAGQTDGPAIAGQRAHPPTKKAAPAFWGSAGANLGLLLWLGTHKGNGSILTRIG